MDNNYTFKQKLENYWYHYKWHTIVVVFFLITFAVCFTQCALKEKPDDKALLYVNQNLLDNAANDLSNELARYIDDYNDNGEILYRVNNVSYNKDSMGTVNYSVANSERLMAAVATAEYVMYIVDENGYNYFMTEQTKLFETYDFMPDKGGTAWNWNGSSLQVKMKNSGLPDNLYFCIRKVSGTTTENDKTVNRLRVQAEDLIKALISE